MWDAASYRARQTMFPTPMTDWAPAAYKAETSFELSTYLYVHYSSKSWFRVTSSRDLELLKLTCSAERQADCSNLHQQ